MINRDSRGRQVCSTLQLYLLDSRLLTCCSIQMSEVKFLDFLKTNYCESIRQGCFH